jgi:REP-associated tyrosine transposase
MPNYRRAFVPGGCWFFTANLLNRRSSLLTDEISALREATRRTQARYRFHIDAVVVLPDHIHAVWTLPPGDADFSIRWRLIKSYFVKSIPKGEQLSPVRQSRGERGIWQRRFWEHLIRDDRDYARHVEYCYINPVKHGHVPRVQDWPFSSFHRDVRDGLFPADWAGDLAEGETSVSGRKPAIGRRAA